MNIPSWINDRCKSYLENKFPIELGLPVIKQEPNKDLLKPEWPKTSANISNAISVIKSEDPEIKKIWVNADKAFSTPLNYFSWKNNLGNRHIFDGQMWLFNAILYSFSPKKPITPAEANRWRTKTLQAIDDLIGLLFDSPAALKNRFPKMASIYANRSKELIKMVVDINKEESCEENKRSLLGDQNLEQLYKIIDDVFMNNYTDMPIMYLSDFKRILKDKANLRSYWSTKTAGKEGERSYFIRSLTHLFYCRTDKLMRDNVQVITNFLFDGNVSTKQIRELTKDIKGDPRHFQEPYMTIGLLDRISQKHSDYYS